MSCPLEPCHHRRAQVSTRQSSAGATFIAPRASPRRWRSRPASWTSSSATRGHRHRKALPGGGRSFWRPIALGAPAGTCRWRQDGREGGLPERRQALTDTEDRCRDSQPRGGRGQEQHSGDHPRDPHPINQMIVAGQDTHLVPVSTLPYSRKLSSSQCGAVDFTGAHPRTSIGLMRRVERRISQRSQDIP